MKRVCFLFNHDQAHQVAHSLPIALELMERPGCSVTLATTGELIEAEVQRYLSNLPIKPEWVRLRAQPRLGEFFWKSLNTVVPASRLAIFADHIEFFRSFDAIVVSEKTSLRLKSRYGVKALMVHTRHGAGDRAIGFDKQSAMFDLVLVAGPKIKKRLVHSAGVPEERIAIVGYSKFDLVGEEQTSLGFPASDRPTVLYNPHPSPHLSSWYDWGVPLLKQMAVSKKFNLICAPHVMLFAKKVQISLDKLAFRRVHYPPSELFTSSHMRFDPGSPASLDMTYTRAADIYIGDVSSQVYEFLRTPRPCLFLNPGKVDWCDDPNFLHWRAGPVTETLENLDGQIEYALSNHPSFLPAQQELLASTFSVTDKPASVRAADAIETRLK